MKAAKDQGDKGLEFNGQGSPVSYKGGEQYSGNRSGLVGKANYGQGPRRGNDGSCDVPISGPSVTRDPVRHPVDTARGGKIDGGTTVKKPGSPDKIRY
jgi:hypothetical protein